MKKPLKVLALCGGKGTRFWPLTNDKLLFSFLGAPFIEYTVNQLLPDQADQLIVVANSCNAKYLSQMKFKISHQVIIQEKPNGMADAILTAKKYLVDSRLIILIGDHLVNFDLLSDILKVADQTSAFGILPGMKIDSYLPYGYFNLKGNQIISIVEKPKPGTEPSQYVDITGHYFSSSDILIKEIERTESINDDVYETALSKLMIDHIFLMHEYIGKSSSLKYSWDILTVCRDIMEMKLDKHQGNNVEIKNNVVIEGQVYIGDNVKIFENTKIIGPVYIGANTIIGNNNMIRESHIGANCVTGFNTDITRSYIGDNCWFHSNYIGDSVLEGNVSMGSGSVLANLRLDESEIHSVVKDKLINSYSTKFGAIIGQNVRIGVNVSVMPGKKIGQNSMIGASVLVNQDIPDGSFCSSKSVMQINPITKKISLPEYRNKYRKHIQ